MKLTHRRQDPDLINHVVLFSDSNSNSHYGNHVWTLKSELPEVTEEIIHYAAEFFGIDFEEAAEFCNPADIVDSAGAWDDARFVSEVYSFCGEPVGFITPDGAVVLDRYAVVLEYKYEIEN